jgi:C_GCAxxG_C_C family probable redox protein
MALKNLDPKDLMERLESLHKQYVEEKLSCSERTFLTVRSVVDTDVPSEVVALLTGFGGGIGGTHASVCGAVSGGVAALGLIYGRRHPAEEQRDRAYEVARDFFCQFKSRFGSEVCGALIGDLLKANGFDSEARRERCFQYTLHAVHLCVDLLAKYEKIYGTT